MKRKRTQSIKDKANRWTNTWELLQCVPGATTKTWHDSLIVAFSAGVRWARRQEKRKGKR